MHTTLKIAQGTVDLENKEIKNASVAVRGNAWRGVMAEIGSEVMPFDLIAASFIWTRNER